MIVLLNFLVTIIGEAYSEVNNASKALLYRDKCAFIEEYAPKTNSKLFYFLSQYLSQTGNTFILQSAVENTLESNDPVYLELIALKENSEAQYEEVIEEVKAVKAKIDENQSKIDEKMDQILQALGKA